MLGVIFYLCCIGLVLTLSLAGPIFVALLVDELEIAKRLLLHFLLGGFLFAGPVIAIRQRIGRVPKIGGLFLVVLNAPLPQGNTSPFYDFSAWILTMNTQLQKAW